MNRKDAVDFLSLHQPMSSGDLCVQEEIDKYIASVDYISQTGDSQLLSLLLGAFGCKVGTEVYEYARNAISELDAELVIPLLTEKMKSPTESVQYWNAILAGDFPDSRLIIPLSHLLGSTDVGTRYMALVALEGIEDETIDGIFRQQLFKETDITIIKLIEETLYGGH